MRYDITSPYNWVNPSGITGSWLKGIASIVAFGDSSAVYKVHSWRQYSGPPGDLTPARPKWNYVTNRNIIPGAPYGFASATVTHHRAQSVVIEHAWCTFDAGDRPGDPQQITNLDISWRPKLIRTRPGRPCHRGLTRSEDATRHHQFV